GWAAGLAGRGGSVARERAAGFGARASLAEHPRAGADRDAEDDARRHADRLLRAGTEAGARPPRRDRIRRAVAAAVDDARRAIGSDGQHTDHEPRRVDEAVEISARGALPRPSVRGRTSAEARGRSDGVAQNLPEHQPRNRTENSGG